VVCHVRWEEEREGGMEEEREGGEEEEKDLTAHLDLI